MRRIAPLALALAASVLIPVSASASGLFTYGVASGEVTSNSAILWAHAQRSGRATLQVASDKGFRHIVFFKLVPASKSHDNTLQAKVTRLASGRTFYYRFRMTAAGKPGGRGLVSSNRGQFDTAPSAGQAKTIRFAWSGDADAQAAKGQTQPFYNSLGDKNFLVYKRMAAEHNNFNVNLGDTIYSDSEVGATEQNGKFQNAIPAALTVKQKWAKYRQNLALPNLSNFRGATTLYSHPDDHEWINDFSQNESLSYVDANGNVAHIQGSKLYKPGVTAFRDYAPVSWSSHDGFYRVFHWGKNLDVFFLDERSFRSAKASANGQCDNPPGSGNPDLAPTAPQQERAIFGAVVPQLQNPPPPGCVDTINSPSRTFLGEHQMSVFLGAVRSSKAKWKAIINEVPIEQLYENPYDRWEGYAAERTKVLDFIKSNVKNVVFLTTDHHGNLVDVIRYKTLAYDGGPINATDSAGKPIYDFATGPVATMTFKREINSATCDPSNTTCDNGSLIDSQFLTPKPDNMPINGLGMDPTTADNGFGCSAIDVFSYGQVTVNSTQFKVQLKDLNGQPVHEEEGTKPACGPYVLTAS